MVLSQGQMSLDLSTKLLEPTAGDMLTNPQLVYEKAEEMAEQHMKGLAPTEPSKAIATQQVQ